MHCCLQWESHTKKNINTTYTVTDCCSSRYRNFPLALKVWTGNVRYISCFKNSRVSKNLLANANYDKPQLVRTQVLTVASLIGYWAVRSGRKAQLPPDHVTTRTTANFRSYLTYKQNNKDSLGQKTFQSDQDIQRDTKTQASKNLWTTAPPACCHVP
jgi:hypothetical protein